jgi:hypothetical protein
MVPVNPNEEAARKSDRLVGLAGHVDFLPLCL